MRELLKDPFYGILKEYDRLVLDYCLMENDSDSFGYQAHYEAIVYAMNQLYQQETWVPLNTQQPSANQIGVEILFAFPNIQWKKRPYENIPYWYAFVEPPHTTGPVIRNGKMIRNKYGKEDFEKVNGVLFPKGIDELEVYEWSTDWSSYFDAGKEWWGTACWSIYDKNMKRYVVIMASATD